ncbi:hypothetical protein JXO52_03370 [bacterium]|nr:hypothetical protein [bacterium]
MAGTPEPGIRHPSGSRIAAWSSPLCAAIIYIIAAASATGQTRREIAARATLAAQSRDWVEGFARAISGERIDYHSTRDDCRLALLSRATDGTMRIAWETAPVQGPASRDSVTFFWLAGMTLAGFGPDMGIHRFDLDIHGRGCISFYSDGSDDWRVSGPKGSSLAFSAFLKDQHGDGFGYMRLTVPADWIAEGDGLLLSITGEAAGSPVWVMVFECPDALSFFQRRAGMESWAFVSVHTENETAALTLTTLGSLTGAPVSLVCGGVRQEGRLKAEGADAAVRFGIDSQSLVNGAASLRVMSEGRFLTEIPLPPVPGSRARLRGDLLVFDSVRVAGPAGWEAETWCVYKPGLPAALKELSARAPQEAEIHLISSSHQDIAWMDSPQQCIEDRDRLIITPTLDLVSRDPGFSFDMEDGLMLREYLERHPGSLEEIRRYTLEGRLGWGAAYTAPYEEMYSGEALVRQFYLGKRWLEEMLPGYTADVYWNLDVPGRTLQMPQILAKSGVEKMIISRHAEGVFRWRSPDGSAVRVYSPGHYSASYPFLKRGFFDAALFTAEQAERWDYPEQLPLLSDWDMARPSLYTDFIGRWRSLTSIRNEDGSSTPLRLPALHYSTAARYLDAAEPAGSNLPVIQGERPNVWVYIHGPAHHRALSACREAGLLLPAAEQLSVFAALSGGALTEYPEQALREAWEAAIYPDHGWGGKNGEITDRLFQEKFEFARDRAEAIVQAAAARIASLIRVDEKAGLPVVVFNTLSQRRSGPVRIRFEAGDERWQGIRVTDGRGIAVPSQTGGCARREDGSIDRAEILFIADDVDGTGYKTWYLREGPAEDRFQDRTVTGYSNRYYEASFDDGGLSRLNDRELGSAVFAGRGLRFGELFSLHSEGNGAGEFAEVQQPDMEGFERLQERPGPWMMTEDGAVRTVIEKTVRLKHTAASQRIIFYKDLKRIDFETDLHGWDGTKNREFRMAFPLPGRDPRVTYEVPFGTVSVGDDELPGAAGERYTTPAKDIHPRGIGRWISASGADMGVTLSSSVAVWDYLDPTGLAQSRILLQPVLLASRRSCHGEGNWYTQEGDHSFRFSVTSHESGWTSGYHAAMSAAEPLRAAVRRKAADRVLPAARQLCVIDARNVIISTVKMSEDGDGIIIRLAEMEGRDTDCTLRFVRPVREAFRTSLIENNAETMKPAEGALRLTIRAHAIETMLVRL